MIVGYVRDNMPRLSMALPGINGELKIEFTLDTAFDGDFALPALLISRLIILNVESKLVRFADGSVKRKPHYEIEMEWDEDIILAEVIEIEGNPLFGTGLLEGSSIHIEMFDGGEVTIEF